MSRVFIPAQATTSNRPHIWDAGEIGYVADLGRVRVRSIDRKGMIRVVRVDDNGDMLPEEIGTYPVEPSEMSTVPVAPTTVPEPNDTITERVEIEPDTHALLVDEDGCPLSVSAARDHENPHSAAWVADVTLREANWMEVTLLVLKARYDGTSASLGIEATLLEVQFAQSMLIGR